MSEDLQFERAEMPVPAANCRSCNAPLRDHYYSANGMMLCDGCVGQLRAQLAGEGPQLQFAVRALVFGVGAAIVGAVGYGLFMGFTNWEFALITIGIGWLVGTAVRKGSGGIGGWPYGLLAVALTYVSIGASYVGVAVASNQLSLSPLLLVAVLAAPVLNASNSILSLLITGFGLWEAWARNRRAKVEITGPHMLNEQTRPAGA